MFMNKKFMNLLFMNCYFHELCHLTFMHIHEEFMYFWWKFMNKIHEFFMNNSSNFRRGVNSTLTDFCTRYDAWWPVYISEFSETCPFVNIIWNNPTDRTYTHTFSGCVTTFLGMLYSSIMLTISFLLYSFVVLNWVQWVVSSEADILI